MSKCSVCQHENDEGSEYCEECGVKLEAADNITLDETPVSDAEAQDQRGEDVAEVNLAPAQAVADEAGASEAEQTVARACHGCGMEIDAGALFCPQCGAKVQQAASGKDVQIRLKLVSGKNKDRVYEIDTTEVFIGRMPENNIALENDAYVSGRHTRILKDGDEYFVEDLGSTNGTFIKVKKLTKLEPGDEVKVGQSIFMLEE